jgi:hypothetical protein
VHLLEIHPDAFEEAKRYEKTAEKFGSPFTWSEHESLEELSKPERILQIKQEYERRIDRLKKQWQTNPLRPHQHEIDIDELYCQSKVCLACHK